jgi:hypothetical protein
VFAPSNFAGSRVFLDTLGVYPRQRLERQHPDGVDIAAEAGIPSYLFVGHVALSPDGNCYIRFIDLVIDRLRTDLLHRTKVNQHNFAVIAATD